MNLSPRYWRYVAIIAILLLLLIIKYIVHHDDDNKGNSHSIQEISIDRYTIHADKEVRGSAVKDIFYSTKVQGVHHQPNYSSRGITNSSAITKPALPKKILEPTTNVSEQNIPSGDGEIERVKLLGIVFHEKKKKAFVALDRQRMIAAVGDTVFGRYVLRDIAINSVELIDTKNNVQKTIIVSGK